MMAPVLEEGAAGRKVYLPEPMTMVRYDGKEFYCTAAERGEISIEAAPNEVVFFILKDKLIPVGKDVKNTGEIDFEQLFLLGDGREYALYADDGLSRDYSPDHIRMLYKI